MRRSASNVLAMVLVATMIAQGSSLAAPTLAAELAIEFTGLNLVYDGTDITDAGDIAGHNGDVSEADPLTTMTFELDGTLIGTLTSDIFADILIPDVEIPAIGGTDPIVGAGGFFDLITSMAGFGLESDIDSFSILYTGQEIAVFGNGVAMAVSNDLPFGPGIVPGSDVSITFSTQIDALTDDGNLVTSFASGGTGETRATAIPEPQTAMIGILGGCVSAIMALRYRWG